jgi:hypothetical protein
VVVVVVLSADPVVVAVLETPVLLDLGFFGEAEEEVQSL